MFQDILTLSMSVQDLAMLLRCAFDEAWQLLNSINDIIKNLGQLEENRKYGTGELLHEIRPSTIKLPYATACQLPSYA